VILILFCLCIPTGIAEKNENNNKKSLPDQSNSINQNQDSLHLSKDYAPDRLIVRYNTDKISTKSGMMSVQSEANTEAGSKVIHDHGKDGVPGMQVVQVTSTTLESAMDAYKANPDVLYVEPDYRISLSPIEEIGNSPDIQNLLAASSSYPNDPQYSNLWGLQNTGQPPFYGTTNADMKGPLAWGVTTGSPGVTVAVVDTGVDYTHPDLAANIWQNSRETVNGIDDDGNGYIDDIRGWNFVSKSNNPMDDNGHGTHCAGTIAAVGNNGIGISGVTWNCKIMPLKFLDSQGSGYTSDAISAILYANQMGVPIISNSWGGLDSQSLKDAIDASSAVVICAAGNNGANSDINPVYPAAYSSNTIISVTATNYHDTLASFANYGINSVDLAAPGVSILSTIPAGGYKYFNGTSMATPYVSGVAALIKSQNPSMTGAQIKSKILVNCDAISSLSGKVATGGRLNAAKALGLIIPTQTPTPYPTTPIVTRTPTQTPTPYPTTPIVTRTPTQTPSPYPTTPIVTKTPTQTRTPYPTPTITRTPTQTPVPYPTGQPSNLCGIYKKDIKTGFLREGQATVFGYYIPADGRSRIEWSMNSYGSSGIAKGLNKNDKPNKKTEYSYVSKGFSTFDLYVFKDCNPKNQYCTSNYYAYGPNSYVSITPPRSGSTYYVMIYARSGSGTYTMQTNSYKCSGNTPITATSAQSVMYTSGAEGAGAGPTISVPTAQFVSY
ncbi:MAG TPA: S8 family peptidase, partial [Methanospirillum sp.]|nr:S8 family peptidase [Methanospirillum sp.]